MKDLTITMAVVVGAAFVACSQNTDPIPGTAGAAGGSTGGTSGTAGTSGGGTGGTTNGGTAGSAGMAGQAGNAGSGGSWSLTGQLLTARTRHTTSFLPSGKVLVAGGQVPPSAGPTNSAEVYDPATGTWQMTSAMVGKRAGACAATLQSGKVLVAGGTSNPGGISSAEVYDPSTDQWTATAQPMSSRREVPTCTLLANGTVLVAGGLRSNLEFPTTSADLYDPGTNTFTPTGQLTTARYWHTATTLASGKVLLAGGCTTGYPCTSPASTSELYDPAAGAFSSTGDLPVGVVDPAAVLLPSGKVLFTGGCEDDAVCGPDTASPGASSKRASVYDPTSGTWSATGDMIGDHRAHTLISLSSGRVLLIGGSLLAGVSNNTTEVYDEASGVWTAGPAPLEDHGGWFGAVKLQSGKWLVMGGVGHRDVPAEFHMTNVAELFTE